MIIHTVTYKAKFDGDMNGLLYYIHQIETFDKRFMKVDKIQIKPGKVFVDDTIFGLVMSFMKLNWKL